MDDDQITNYYNSIQQLIDYTEANASTLSPEALDEIKITLQEADQFFSQLKKQVVPSNDAQLLWILGGGNPDMFMQYLQSFNTPETQSLLNNPYALKKVMEELSSTNPFQGIIDEKNGVPRAQLQSSNVFGSKYDPSTGKLRVQFQNGGLYDYFGVSPDIANAFQSASRQAKTNGENDFGRWWVGKNSLGASLNQLIKQGGYGYQKVA